MPPVTASINYVTTQDKFVPPEPLFSYTYSPRPNGRPQTNERYAPADVLIDDIRQHPELNAENAGFQVVQSETGLAEEDFEAFSSNVDRWEALEPTEQKLAQYHSEVEAILKKTFPGSKKVITYNQKTRLHEPKTTVEGYDFSAVVNFPVLRPHIDLVPDSAAETAKAVSEGASRVLIVNTWRPIRGIVLDAPLAVADARTVNSESKVHNRVLYRDREKGMYMIRNEGDIKWYHISSQKPNEVLVFKQYDSQNRDHVPAHSAFVDPQYDGAPGVVPRYSIETRSVVLF